MKRLLSRFVPWSLWSALRRSVGRARELIRYAVVSVKTPPHLYVVSCQRNAGSAAATCLQSVYTQNYPTEKYTHLYIDDASDDDTDQMVRQWLESHPGHRVHYIRRDSWCGGAFNTVDGFRMAPPQSVVVELNGDDWLSDPGVFAFLAKVYTDSDVWVTYNTHRFSWGKVAQNCYPIHPRVVRENSFRECPNWTAAAPHTFRRELFDHVDEFHLIDPQTGEYWASADDQAIHLAMLELSGCHSRHVERVLYIYNYREQSHYAFERGKSDERARRIRSMPRYEPLRKL